MDMYNVCTCSKLYNMVRVTYVAAKIWLRGKETSAISYNFTLLI